MDKSTVMKNYRFLALILFVMVAGRVAGWSLPELGHFIKSVGTAFTNMMFCMVVLLVFASTSNSVTSVRSRKRAGKIMGTTVLTFVVTGAVAVVTTFIAMKLVLPVLESWTDMATETIGEHALLADMVVNLFTTDNFVGLLSRSTTLPLIAFSILFGFATNLAGGPDHIIGKFLDGLTEVMMVFVKIITYYAPIVFFASLTDLVATYGSSVASAYDRVMVVYYPPCFIYIFTAFPFLAYIGGGRHDIKTTFQHIVRPTIMPLGTCSSSATIPINLREAEDVGVPKDMVDMVVSMGATIHMDGSCFPCVLKIVFVLGAMGVDMPWTMPLVVVAAAVFFSVGTSGVPDEGYIGEYITCPIFFPQQIEVTFPILAAIGNLVDPPATMINSAGDYVVYYIIARVTDGKDRLDRTIVVGHTKQHPPGAPCGAGHSPEKQKGNEI